MSATATARMGAAKIVIEARGCIECGAEHASAWKPVKIVVILVGRSLHQVVVSRCAACAAPQPKQLELQQVGGS
jgi:hypothetical protein